MVETITNNEGAASRIPMMTPEQFKIANLMANGQPTQIVIRPIESDTDDKRIAYTKTNADFDYLLSLGLIDDVTTEFPKPPNFDREFRAFRVNQKAIHLFHECPDCQQSGAIRPN